MTRRPVIDLLKTMEGWEERESWSHVKRSKIDARREIERHERKLGLVARRECETGKVEASGADEETAAAGEDEDGHAATRSCG